MLNSFQHLFLLLGILKQAIPAGRQVQNDIYVPVIFIDYDMYLGFARGWCEAGGSN